MGRAAQCPGCGNALALISIPGPDAGSPAPQYAAFSQAAGTRGAGRRGPSLPRSVPALPPSPATPCCWLAEATAQIRETPQNEDVQRLPRGWAPRRGPAATQGRGEPGEATLLHTRLHSYVHRWKRGPHLWDQTYWPSWQVAGCHLGHVTDVERGNGLPRLPSGALHSFREPEYAKCLAQGLAPRQSPPSPITAPQGAAYQAAAAGLL